MAKFSLNFKFLSTINDFHFSHYRAHPFSQLSQQPSSKYDYASKCVPRQRSPLLSSFSVNNVCRSSFKRRNLSKFWTSCRFTQRSCQRIKIYVNLKLNWIQLNCCIRQMNYSHNSKPFLSKCDNFLFWSLELQNCLNCFLLWAQDILYKNLHLINFWSNSTFCFEIALEFHFSRVSNFHISTWKKLRETSVLIQEWEKWFLPLIHFS